VQNLLIALSQTPPSPEGTLRPGLSEDQITPGTWGFLLTAFVVVLTILLIVDMVRRLRRVRYRAQVEEAREAEREPEKAEPAREEAERAPEKGEPEA
jgi:flagellar biosynthesis/type III secretory pathway M-ring protein FliF/YscJ